MQPQIIIKPNPWATSDYISKVRKQAKAFANAMQKQGQDISVIHVNWTPSGEFGGLLVTKPQNDENLNPEMHPEDKKTTSKLEKKNKKGRAGRGRRELYTDNGIKIKLKLK